MRKLFLMSVLLLATQVVSAQYRDVKVPEAPKHSGYRNYDAENSGFFCALEAEGSSSVMIKSKNMQYTTLSGIGGYRINEFLRIGVGLGVRYYVNNAEVRGDDNKFGMPVFANARGNFVSAYDRDGVPFWSVNIGGVTNDGFYFSPTVGYSFGGLRNNFQIGLTYTLQSFKDANKDGKSYSYLGIKLGYEF